MLYHYFINTNVLTPMFAVVMSLLTAVLSFFLFAQRKQCSRKTYMLAAFEVLAITLFISLALKLLFEVYQLPSDILILSLPISIVIVVIQISWRSRPLFVGLGVLNLVLVLVFCLTLGNDYYHYYPTLGSIFNIKHSSLQDQSKQVVSTSNTASVLSSSIEGGLYNNTKDPTYSGTIKEVNIPPTKSGFKARPSYVYTP